MSLTDIMSNADLATWPQAAMVIFFGVFFLVVYRAIFVTRRDEMKRNAHLALEEGPVVDNNHPGHAAEKEANANG